MPKQKNHTINSSIYFEAHPYLHGPTGSVIPEDSIRRREIRKHVEILMFFLEDHGLDGLLRRVRIIARNHPLPTVGVRQYLRKIIGEMNWRRYLDYYRHYEANNKERIVIEPTRAHSSDPPPLPTLSNDLNASITEAIFSFLEEKDVFEASKVSRSFREALVPRQRNITIAGFTSFESFSSMDFRGAVYFSGESSDMMTDQVLRLLCCDHSFPNLTRIDITHCSNVTFGCQCNCQFDMGPRADLFYCDEPMFDFKPTPIYFPDGWLGWRRFLLKLIFINERK